MKYLSTATAILVLSSTLAIAQTTPNSGAATPNTGGVANPGAPSSPTTGSGASVGAPAGVNPSNPQDLSNRSNPQDLTKPGASNRQDMKR